MAQPNLEHTDVAKSEVIANLINEVIYLRAQIVALTEEPEPEEKPD